MTSINLGKCIHFPEVLLLLRSHENVVFFSKTTQNKVLLFPRKYPFCYVLFSDCPYFQNNILDKLYSYKLRNCNSNDKYLYTYLYLYLYLSIYLSIYWSIDRSIYVWHSAPLHNNLFAKTLDSGYTWDSCFIN